MLHPAFRPGCLLSLGALLCGGAACAAPPASDPPAARSSVSRASSSSPDEAGPLRLRVPIFAVMAGVIHDASYAVFQKAVSGGGLTEKDWQRVGLAAADLVGAATLITLPGTGDKDAQWVVDPRWRRSAADMQEASLAVGAAAVSRDHAALAASAASLAQACQTCHMAFSARLLSSSPAADGLPPR